MHSIWRAPAALVRWIVVKAALFSAPLLVCPALLLYLFANELTLIGLGALVYRRVCLRDFNSSVCGSLKNHHYAAAAKQVQQAAADQQILLNIAFIVPAIVAIVCLSGQADRRANYRTSLLVSLVGSIAHSLLCVLASQLPAWNDCALLLFVAQVSNGLLGGGSLTFISSCFSHVALQHEKCGTNHSDRHAASASSLSSSPDVDAAVVSTDDTVRPVRHQQGSPHRVIFFALCESSLLIGQFVGSMLSGFVIGDRTNMSSYRNTYIITSSLYLTVLVYVVLMFYYVGQSQQERLITDVDEDSQEEDLQVDRSADSTKSTSRNNTNTHSSWASRYVAAQLAILTESFKLLTKRRENNGRFQILSLLFLFFMGASVSLGIMSSQYLYLISKPISLSQVNYGFFKGFNTMCRFLSLIAVLPCLKHYVKIADHYLFFIGLASEMLNLVVFTVAYFSPNVIWIAPIVYSCCSYYVVCIRSIIAKIASPSEVGKLFGLVGVVEFLVMLTSSNIFALIFKSTIATVPWLIFVIGIAICILVIVPYQIYIIRDLKRRSLTPPIN